MAHITPYVRVAVDASRGGFGDGERAARSLVDFGDDALCAYEPGGEDAGRGLVGAGCVQAVSLVKTA